MQLAERQQDLHRSVVPLQLHQNLAIPQHALSPICQELSNLAGEGTHLLVLHKVLVGEMADGQANCQVEREETVRHRLPPKLFRDYLLVEHLANRPVHDKHREGLRQAKTCKNSSRDLTVRQSLNLELCQ